MPIFCLGRLVFRDGCDSLRERDKHKVVRQYVISFCVNLQIPLRSLLWDAEDLFFSIFTRFCK